MNQTCNQHSPTWDVLTEMEPRLLDLIEEAKAVDGSGVEFCAMSVWASRCGLKSRMMKLVGFERPRTDTPERERLLQSHQAYEVAYDEIVNSLPPCRQCGCI